MDDEINQELDKRKVQAVIDSGVMTPREIADASIIDVTEEDKGGEL